MKKLKLNKLNQISEEMKNAVVGGAIRWCRCCCQYAEEGGASIDDNFGANYNGGLSSQDCEVKKKKLNWHAS